MCIKPDKNFVKCHEKMEASFNQLISFFRNDVLQRYLERLGEKNPWLKLAHYEYANIVQSSPFIKQFNQYHQLLDILWWRNLRIANWQRFLNALEQHTAIYSYTIYMGTVGEVQTPLWSNPGEFQYLQIQVQISFFFQF